MKRLLTFAAATVAAASMALAATKEPSLTCQAPFPGSDTGRIYYFVPRGLDLSKPAPLLMFMHGGNRKSPDDSPERYLDLKTGTMMPTLCDAPFIVAAPSAPPVAADAPKKNSRWCQPGGTKDVLPRWLDVHDEANAQGPNRFERFKNFRDYVATFPQLKGRFRFVALEGRPHGGACYDNDDFIDLAFGKR
ncbi:MAG: hypothetical protein IJ658_05940 [Kiritimatiellae bacterium]|nr:hypothetical protein [Kiritimatiellia bacterium]